MRLTIFGVPGVFRSFPGFTDTPTSLLSKKTSEKALGRDETLRQTSHARTVFSQMFGIRSSLNFFMTFFVTDYFYPHPLLYPRPTTSTHDPRQLAILFFLIIQK